MTTIGVISFQGDFERHLEVFHSMGVESRPVRRPEELRGLDGLVIPGGESTTIGMLMDRFGLLQPVVEAAGRGELPVMGTCAGAILLAQRISGSDQIRLGLMDMEIQRNAYGRQVDSFEASVDVPVLGEPPVAGVFIRAPKILSVHDRVSVLGSFEDAPVLVRQDNLLALSFHPELTGDFRIHRYFLTMNHLK